MDNACDADLVKPDSLNTVNLSDDSHLRRAFGKPVRDSVL
jgi:hypothetical protein